jgi:hypothetical protein
MGLEVLAAAGLAASVGGGLMSGQAAKKGAKQQAAAAREAAALQEKRYQENVGYAKPYMTAGTNALDMYSDYLGMNGGDAQSKAMRGYQTSPFFQQNVQNTADATSAQYAAHGMTGGNLLDALYKNNAGMWNQEYQNYLGQLKGVTDQGLNATNSLAGTGTQSAATQGNLISQAGAAQGAGTMGWGNAVGNAMNNIGIWSMMGNTGGGGAANNNSWANSWANAA